MFNILIVVLFGLILLAYIFSQPEISNINMPIAPCSKDLKSELVPFPKITLEEQIINNMKTTTSTNEDINTLTFQPVLPETTATILN